MGLSRLKFYEYNSMFFTERSVTHFQSENREVFFLIEKLKASDPGLQVDWVLAADRQGCFPFPIFRNGNARSLASLRESLSQSFYGTPLDLYPEFVGSQVHLENVADVDIAEIEAYWIGDPI